VSGRSVVSILRRSLTPQLLAVGGKDVKEYLRINVRKPNARLRKIIVLDALTVEG
jgi:hypothetical protein